MASRHQKDAVVRSPAMPRRAFLATIAGGLLAAPLATEAQEAGKVYRVGFLGNSTAALEANLVGSFREGLRDLGYVEGRNVVIEYRWADGKYERFPALVAELLALKVDVIVSAGTPAAVAVKQATTTVPLVMAAVGDPVGTGLIASLARPGGNLTGLAAISPDLEGKRFELLRELLPKLSLVSFMVNPANPLHSVSEKHAREAAKVLRLRLEFVGVRTEAEFDHAFDTIVRERPGAMVVLADRVFLHNRERIVAFAARHRLPTVYPYRELVDAGGLMCFGPNYPDLHRRAAIFVDKILKGASPANLPVEQPTNFELVINVRTATALGLTIPPSLLARADQVVE